jgi:toxin-antitoxin system PIN domain toxin
LKTFLPDINVLIASAREDHSTHAAAKSWLAQTVADARSGLCKVAFPMLVVSGFVRIATHPKIMDPPNTPSEALAYIEALLALLQTTVSEVSTWEPFQTLVARQQLAGNDVPDAWLASYALATDAVVVTFDKGFKKLLPKSQVMLLSPR